MAQPTCHPVSLSGSRQVVLFPVVWLSQFEEILQSEELADALPDRATGHQSVPSIIHQQELVHIVRPLQSGGKRQVGR